MGMAASQARFLQLTARKSNAEYQGQQINQARTALANKSAGLFEKLLALQPPTPPSSMDDKYYDQGYTFTDPADEMRKKITWTDVDNTSAGGITSNVNYYKYTDATNTVVTTATASIDLTLSELYNSLPTKAFDTDGDGVNDGIELDLATIQANGTISGLDIPENVEKATIQYATFSHVAYDEDGNYTTFVEKKPIIAYFDNQERLLDFQAINFSSAYDSTDVGGTSANPMAYNQVPDEDNLVLSAAASKSPIQEAYDQVDSGNSEVTKDLTYNGDFDDVLFQQDMDDYEFKKATYDYQVERINTETKQIQQEDKSLELKLKQIDTEHNAIQTEMEAVSKVITKNIESTFKTFA